MVNTVDGLRMVHAVNHVIQVLRQREELATTLHLLMVDHHVQDHLHIVSIVTLNHVLNQQVVCIDTLTIKMMVMANQCIWIAIPFTVHLDTSSTTSSYKETVDMTKSDIDIDVADLNSRVLTHAKPTENLTTEVVRVTVSIWIVNQSNVATKVSAT